MYVGQRNPLENYRHDGSLFFLFSSSQKVSKFSSKKINSKKLFLYKKCFGKNVEKYIVLNLLSPKKWLSFSVKINLKTNSFFYQNKLKKKYFGNIFFLVLTRYLFREIYPLSSPQGFQNIFKRNYAATFSLEIWMLWHVSWNVPMVISLV